MKLNGVPIFHENNLPLLVGITLTLLYLIQSKQMNLLFVILPILYIFRERLSELYIQEAFPVKNTTLISEGSTKQVRETLSPTLLDILSKLRSYRVYSPFHYRNGKRYLKMFDSTLKELSRNKVYNSKQLFQNSEEYLRLALNHFQAISFSVPEPNYTQTLRYNTSASSNARQRIGELCKRLHKLCYHILYNYSQGYDQKFYEKPNIYSGELAYSTDNVKESNRFLANELH